MKILRIYFWSNNAQDDVFMFAGLGRRSPMAGAGDGDLLGEKMVGGIQDTFPPSVNYSNVAGIRTNYSGEVCQYIYTIHLQYLHNVSTISTQRIYNIYKI